MGTEQSDDCEPLPRRSGSHYDELDCLGWLPAPQQVRCPAGRAKDRADDSREGRVQGHVPTVVGICI